MKGWDKHFITKYFFKHSRNLINLVYFQKNVSRKRDSAGFGWRMVNGCLSYNFNMRLFLLFKQCPNLGEFSSISLEYNSKLINLGTNVPNLGELWLFCTILPFYQRFFKGSISILKKVVWSTVLNNCCDILLSLYTFFSVFELDLILNVLSTFWFQCWFLRISL